MAELTKFILISEALTGVRPLDRKLAQEYLLRIIASPEAAVLDAFFDEFADESPPTGGLEIPGSISERTEFKKIARVIILLWYLGEMRGDLKVNGRPEHYFQGLIWKIVHAHPPGLSGGYFGHWTYPPDN